MKNNIIEKINLVTLVEQLKAQQLTKLDLVISAKNLSFEKGMFIIKNLPKRGTLAQLLSESNIEITGDRNDTVCLKPTEHFLRQVCAKMDLPWTYMEKLYNDDKHKHVMMFDANANYWLSLSRDNYFVRSFAPSEGSDDCGVARAFLTDRYRVLDNYDVLMATLDAVKQTGVNLKVESADITERKMYVRFIAPDVTLNAPELLRNYRVPGTNRNVKPGDDGIMAGFVLTNSEVGEGSSFVAPRLVVSACSNGMIMKQDAVTKVHIGSRMDENTAIEWSEDTRQQNVRLIIAQVKDAVKHFVSNKYLGKAIDHLVEKGTDKLEHPVDTVKNVTREMSYTDEQSKSILDFFVQSGDLTPFGVAQAVTYHAHKKANADQRFELEGQVLELVEAAVKHDKPFVEKKKRTSNKGFGSN